MESSESRKKKRENRKRFRKRKNVDLSAILKIKATKKRNLKERNGERWTTVD